MDLDQSLTKPAIPQRSANATNASDVSILKARPHAGVGIAHAHIYIISLADRQDRREQMEFLRRIQDLTWTIVDAVPGNATLVTRILDWVALCRAEGKKTDAPDFRWPEEINAFSISHKPLKNSGADTWTETLPSSKSKRDNFGPPTDSSLPCAIEDDSIPTFMNGTPEWMVLSPAKVACWHSHISAIRLFIEGHDSDDHRREDKVAIILEDDIDMEKDVSNRLSQVWTFLPAGWDIVFLGEYANVVRRKRALYSEQPHALSRSLLVRRSLLSVAHGIHVYQPSSITLPKMHACIRTLALRSAAASAAPALPPLCIFSRARSGVCVANPEWPPEELFHRPESRRAKEERK